MAKFPYSTWTGTAHGAAMQEMSSTDGCSAPGLAPQVQFPSYTTAHEA